MFSNTAIVSRLRASTLCQRDLPVSTAWQAIGWWEARRVAFNLVVGGAGILSGLVVGVVGIGSYFLFDSDFGVPDPPLFADGAMWVGADGGHRVQRYDVASLAAH